MTSRDCINPFFFFSKKCFTSFVTFVTVLTQAHEACGPMEIDSALTAIQTLRSELQDAKAAAASEQLKPLPGESVSNVPLNSDTQEFAIKHRTDSDSVFLLSRSRFFFCPFCFSWRNVLRIWAAPPRPSVPPWLSCSRAPHREMNTTQVGAGGDHNIETQFGIACKNTGSYLKDHRQYLKQMDPVR